MNRTMLKSKIHRATVTGSDLHYVGSITIDADLLEAADIREHEQVHVVDVDNGARFETYTIAGTPGSGEIKINGAAARLVHTGDTVIVISYASYDENVYTFVVAPDANKIEIRRAVEQIFNVHVTNVNTLNRKGKRKRNRRTGVWGNRASQKRALVSLREGDRIDIFGS